MIFEFFIYLRTYNPILSAITVKKKYFREMGFEFEQGKKMFFILKKINYLCLYLYADAKTFKVNLYLVAETGIQFIL